MTKEKNEIKVAEVDSKGYGKIPKLVMKDKDLAIEAKAIYAYLCSYAGSGNTAFPSVSLMCDDLNISDNRFYKYKKQLTDKGYITVSRKRVEGKWETNVYKIEPYLQNLGMDNPGMENKGTNNNSSNNNSSNNSSSNSCPDSEKSDVKFDETTKPYQFAAYLRDKILENNKRQPVPDETPEDLEDWAVELDRLNRLGTVGAKDKGYTWNEIQKIIDWCQDDNFWKTNILSAGKLRKQVVKLENRMKSESYSNSSTKGKDLSENDIDKKYYAENVPEGF